jgi:coniferyl-aldehyde dehydrogenase
VPDTGLRAEAPPSSTDDELRALFERQKAAVLEHRYPSVGERRASLHKLLAMVQDNETTICDAMASDFKGHKEALAVGMLPTVLAIKHAIRNVGAWMRPQRRRLNPIFGLWQTRVDYHPLGVIGVISPWNYPLFLSLGPIVGALAAGNRVMLKLSEHCPSFSAAFAKLVADTFPPEQFTVVNGGPQVAAAFSKLPFDHLVFTGSTDVGRLVAKAAAENLTPTTLELGGKSPVFITRDYSMANINALVFGKLVNSGQSCTAPDYVLVHEERRDDFVKAYEEQVAALYPSWASETDVSRIVNERHLKRIEGYLDDAKDKGATVRTINPGDDSPERLAGKLLPALVLDVTDDMKVMQEEIFGPLLPVKTYRELSEAIDYVNARPHPLALYVFSHDQREVDRIRFATQSGNFGVNFATIQFGFDEVPAGGVGFSGMGHYHGEDGFLQFSHARPYVKPRINASTLLFPPFGKFFRRVIDFVVRR